MACRQVGMSDDTMCLDVPPVWVEHLLPHLDWQTRANLFTLNKKWLALGGAKPSKADLAS